MLLVEVGEKPDSYSAGQAPTNNLVEATDSISIVGIKTGAGGVAFVNSNHAHTYAVPNGGLATNISITGTTLELVVGGVVYTYIGGTGAHGYNNPSYTSGGALQNKQWYLGDPTVTGGSSDLTIGTPTGVSSNVVTIGNHTGTANTDPEEVITWTAHYKQAGVAGKTITTTQTLTKSEKGVEGQSVKTVSVFRIDDTTLGFASGFTAASQTFANPTNGLETGWNTSQPTISANDQKVYAFTRTFTSDGASPQDAAWTGPIIVAQRTDGGPGGPGFFFIKRTGNNNTTATNVAGANLGAPSSSEIASPADKNIAIVENNATTPNQAAWKYESSAWVLVSDFFRAEVIAANAIGASQLAISNAAAGSAGIYMEVNSGNSRIIIRDSSAERVRIGYLS